MALNVVESFGILCCLNLSTVKPRFLNSFWKAVQKPICSNTESYFPVTNNVKEINLFHVPKE